MIEERKVIGIDFKEGREWAKTRVCKTVATVICRHGACQFGHQVGDTVAFETQRFREEVWGLGKS